MRIAKQVASMKKEFKSAACHEEGLSCCSNPGKMLESQLRT